MHQKIKDRPKGGGTSGGGVEPLLPHQAANEPASFITAPSRRTGVVKPMPGATDHLRHHVSRKTQS
jgi:hypothetical protein